MAVSPFVLLASLFLTVERSSRLVEEVWVQAAADLRILRAAGLPTDGPGLLRFFRNQSATEPEEKAIARAVKALGDRSFKARERAAVELTSCGPAALPVLRQYLKGTELESRRRLERCLRAIQARHPRSAVWGAAARRVEALCPDGVCAALLACLPAAREDARDEILATLLAIGARNGKLDPAVIAAQTDPCPECRTAAALVFAWRGDAKQQEEVRRMLRTDSQPQVVLRAAEGLLAIGDVTAIPILIDRIRAGDDEVALCADDLLRWADFSIIPDHPGRWDAVGRQQCHAYWQAWWRRQKDQIHLPRRSPAALTPLAKRAARLAAQRFCDALPGGNLAALRRWADFPFHTSLGERPQTVTDDRAFGERLRGQRVIGPRWAVTQVLQLSHYLLRRGWAGQPQLYDLPGSRIVIVYAESPAGRNVRVIAAFVRVRDDQARVVGMRCFSAPRLP